MFLTDRLKMEGLGLMSKLIQCNCGSFSFLEQFSLITTIGGSETASMLSTSMR
ncbi:hypothetical protein Mgra_00005699 [Meloidogyne graminicola]|uniref:Uncharacterized protein n=1 Tax=Meloidogyne graminicola TaxID=189291 RepID=A0A8S9ZNZ7_9BILA|nr:hypothetical protein Mgra_00005699 [Meloidogyne graminicola]